MTEYDDLLKRAQLRLRKVDVENPTPDDDLICDLVNAMKVLIHENGKEQTQAS